jgi:hypothetical protein
MIKIQHNLISVTRVDQHPTGQIKGPKEVEGRMVDVSNWVTWPNTANELVKVCR